MSDLFWLTDAQMAKAEPFFPKSHGKARVDDKRVLSGIIFINHNGLRRLYSPAEYGPPKMLYNLWKRWSEKGIFARMLRELADQGGPTDTLMIDATHQKTHRTVSSPGLKKGAWPPDWPQQRRNKLQAARRHGCPGLCPLRMYLTAGQRSGHIVARTLLVSLRPAEHMLADHGYDSNWYCETRENKGIKPCIRSRERSQGFDPTR